MIFAVVLLAGLQSWSSSHVIPCWAVKKAIAQYGAIAVESWARANSVSDKEIEQAKRCLR
jgi:hypothetical protein